jgi:N-glycosylase/DNA lyase
MFTGFQSISIPISQLSLPAVLKCGQSFRWHEIHLPQTDEPELSDRLPKLENEYRLALKDRVICLRQTPNALFYRALYPKLQMTRPVGDCDTENLTWLRDYFQLNVDLVELYDDWSSRDAVFSKLRNRFQGIRILRQDPWENLISWVYNSFVLVEPIFLADSYVPQTTILIEYLKWFKIYVSIFLQP